MKSFFPFLNCCTYDSLVNFSRISPEVQTDLKQDYLSVCFPLLMVAVGAYLHILWNFGVIVPIFATLGCMFWLLTNPPPEESKGLSMLIMAFCLFSGASFAPIYKLAIDSGPSILVTYFVGGAIIFACFSGAATLTRRREFLYLGSLVSSSVLIFFWLQFASKIFGGDVTLYQSEFFFELMVILGYMVVQTQVVINDMENKELEWKGAEEEEEGDYEEKLHLTTNKNPV